MTFYYYIFEPIVIISSYEKLKLITIVNPTSNIMGFTVYWSQKATDSKTFYKFIALSNDFISQKSDIVWSDSYYYLKSPDHGMGEDFYIHPYVNASSRSCKTFRKPYTKDILVNLILMTELGFASNITMDGNSEYRDFILGKLDEINSKTPLNTYSEQVEYYKNLI
jgi:hypothetical protein